MVQMNVQWYFERYTVQWYFQRYTIQWYFQRYTVQWYFEQYLTNLPSMVSLLSALFRIRETTTQINGMRSYDLYIGVVSIYAYDNNGCALLWFVYMQYDSSVLAFDWIGNKRMTQYN